MTLSEEEGCHPDVWSNLACCYFMLGMYTEADNAIQKGNVTSSTSVLITYSLYSCEIISTEQTTVPSSS